VIYSIINSVKTNGILLALSSLPSEYGVGGFGKEAFYFAKKIRSIGMKIRQLLPINPIDYGNSPYQSKCGEAIDPIYVDVDDLIARGLLKRKEISTLPTSSKVDYEGSRNLKEKLLRIAFSRQKDTLSAAFAGFLKNNERLRPYAEFLTLSIKNDYQLWYYRNKDERYAFYGNFDFKPYENEILYHERVQYILFSEFFKLKEHCSIIGLSLMGDIPFYVGENSSDVWSNQDEFLLNQNDIPAFVAGVPPDFFSATGQRWGNPIYDWEYMKKDCFTFWKKRMINVSKMFDYIRIDHFRAFDTYRKIPSFCPTAIEGEWCKSYGRELFKEFKKLNLKSTIIAEDLGDLFPSVIELRDSLGLDGMNILEFTLLDPNFKESEKQVVYTGTHDNDTVVGRYSSLDEKNQAKIQAVFEKNNVKSRIINRKFVELAYKAKAEIAIIPMQDILGLPSSYRMNTPGTVGEHNRVFKLENFTPFDKSSRYLKKLLLRTGR
jgi:4-alpha-glucanotransferase